jgi:CubicO group peptidase (beta-lactamase class C family)
LIRCLASAALVGWLQHALALAACADSIDDYVQRRMDRNHIPAVAVAVVQSGQVTKLRSYGVANLEWNALATVNSTFQLASATKPFTGVILMLLVEQRKLSLDESATRYLTNAPSSWNGITIRHLASHTSGLSEAANPATHDSVDQLVQAAMTRPLAFPPGDHAAYGFIDYIVLSAIFEKVTGKSYSVLLRELVAEPLEMTATAFNHQTEHGPIRLGDPLRERASVYQWENGTQKNFEFLYEVSGYAAGGLYSSASDLAKFLLALSENRLLTAASCQEMWTAPTLPGGARSEFGLGWVVRRYRGERVVGHSGGPALADILYFPDRKMAIAVLVNQERMYPLLAEGVADLLLPPRSAPKPIPDTDPEVTARLKRVLMDAAEGRADPEAIAEEARPTLVPTLKQSGPLVIGVLDPIERLDLIDEQRSDDGRRRTRKYSVLFGDTPRTWLFELDAKGRITSIQPISE